MGHTCLVCLLFLSLSLSLSLVAGEAVLEDEHNFSLPACLFFSL